MCKVTKFVTQVRMLAPDAAIIFPKAAGHGGGMQALRFSRGFFACSESICRIFANVCLIAHFENF